MKLIKISYFNIGSKIINSPEIIKLRQEIKRNKRLKEESQIQNYNNKLIAEENKKELISNNMPLIESKFKTTEISQTLNTTHIDLAKSNDKKYNPFRDNINIVNYVNKLSSKKRKDDLFFFGNQVEKKAPSSPDEAVLLVKECYSSLNLINLYQECQFILNSNLIKVFILKYSNLIDEEHNSNKSTSKDERIKLDNSYKNSISHFISLIKDSFSLLISSNINDFVIIQSTLFDCFNNKIDLNEIEIVSMNNLIEFYEAQNNLIIASSDELFSFLSLLSIESLYDSYIEIKTNKQSREEVVSKLYIKIIESYVNNKINELNSKDDIIKLLLLSYKIIMIISKKQSEDINLENYYKSLNILSSLLSLYEEILMSKSKNMSFSDISLLLKIYSNTNIINKTFVHSTLINTYINILLNNKDLLSLFDIKNIIDSSIIYTNKSQVDYNIISIVCNYYSILPFILTKTSEFNDHNYIITTLLPFVSAVNIYTSMTSVSKEMNIITLTKLLCSLLIKNIKNYSFTHKMNILSYMLEFNIDFDNSIFSYLRNELIKGFTLINIILKLEKTQITKSDISNKNSELNTIINNSIIGITNTNTNLLINQYLQTHNDDIRHIHDIIVNMKEDIEFYIDNSVNLILYYLNYYKTDTNMELINHAIDFLNNISEIYNKNNKLISLSDELLNKLNLIDIMLSIQSNTSSITNLNIKELVIANTKLTKLESLIITYNDQISSINELLLIGKFKQNLKKCLFSIDLLSPKEIDITNERIEILKMINPSFIEQQKENDNYSKLLVVIDSTDPYEKWLNRIKTNLIKNELSQLNVKILDLSYQEYKKKHDNIKNYIAYECEIE